jgi:hypothetical protein
LVEIYSCFSNDSKTLHWHYSNCVSSPLAEELVWMVARSFDFGFHSCFCLVRIYPPFYAVVEIVTGRESDWDFVSQRDE